MDEERSTSVAITPQLRGRFERAAAAALARRNDAYLAGVAMNVLQWLLVGSLGLLGLRYWQWTATEMLLVFVAGIFASIAIDGLRWLFARGRMLSDYQKMQDDRLVWAVLDADAGGRDSIPTDQLERKSPGGLTASDIVFGALGAWLLWKQRAAFGFDAAGAIAISASARLSLIALFAMPVLSLLVGLLAHRRDDGGHDELEFRAGGRGIGLVLLAGAIAWHGGGSDGARAVMTFVNWATVVAGVLSIGGVAIMVRERNRLRTHLARRRGDGGEAATPKRRKRRSR